MIPQILLNVLQTGGKYFFDLDPTLTEHLVRHMALQVVTFSQTSADAMLQISNKCAMIITPLADGFRNVRIHLTQS
jgi:hypothetical protein